jgi:hypothetical protein
MSELRVEGAIYIRVEKTSINVVVPSDYYDVDIISSNTYTFAGFTLPNLSLYTLKSVNESLKVFGDGIKFWWNNNDQNFSDQYIQNGNTLEFLDTVERIEIEFTNKLILI